VVELELWQGDCLELMEDIPDGSVDMILCDLPYGTTACKWDTIIPLEPLWSCYERIIKDNGAIVLFGSEPFSSKLRMSNLKMYKYDWIWVKNTSGGFATAKKRPMKYHENISVFFKRQPTYNPQMQEYSDSTKKRFKDGDMVNRTKQLQNSTNSIQAGLSFAGEKAIDYSKGKYPESVQFFKSVPNSNGIRQHPTQKPVELLEYLIKTYTNENDTILDNCMGSGSTGVACKNTNRKFIGIELDEKYFNMAKERIESIK
jgi:site-specific DNA-methyltransferase (adenine-specific)